MIKKLGFFSAPLIVMGVGALVAAGCDPAAVSEDVCGDCGSVATGDVGISGNAKLDGFFAAVSTLNSSAATLSGNFELGLKNLEAAFGVEASGELDARVGKINAAIKAEIEANASAGLTVKVEPAKCSANVNVAVEAQAQCEVKADCEVDPGNVSVECSGSCSGSCDGKATCSGEAKAYCKAEAPMVTCEGKCEGSCELEASAACEGTCKGECSGECSAYVKNADGKAECAGQCDGMCTGSCEASVAAKCEGECKGSCYVEQGSAECDADVDIKCDAEVKCEGKCEGGCTGEVTPPKAECDAAADCQAQAKAQASASVECTPPSIQASFMFSGDADAQASFEAKMAALKLNAPLMISAFTNYTALFTGEVNGKAAFDPAPVAVVTASLNTVISAGADGSLFADIPTGRIGCVIPALESSVTMLGTLTSEATADIAAQAEFVTAFSTGFKG